MTIKVKYTITEIREDHSENWDEQPKTPEELIELIKKEIENDPSYVLDGLNHFTTSVELVEVVTKDA